MFRMMVSALALSCSAAIAVPPGPVADPSGIAKNRYISMSVPSNGGEPMALRVTLTSLMSPQYGTGPDFSAFEGENRWVGPPVFSTENDNDPTPFIAAPLQCTPYYHDWSTLELFHVYGDAVVPGSLYDVVVLDQDCAGTESTCSEISSELQIATRCRWADTCDTCGEVPQQCDYINSIIKFERQATEGKAHLQLQPNIPDPTRTINVRDVLSTIRTRYFSANNYPYPWPGPSSCNAAPTPANSTTSSEGVSTVMSGGTLKVLIKPGPAQGTTSYPAGTVINGHELYAPVGGFRAFFVVQFQNWNPGNTGPVLHGWQIQLDTEGLRGLYASPPAPGADVIFAQVPCTTGNQCRTAFDEAGTTCRNNQCLSAYVTTHLMESTGFPTRPDWFLLAENDEMAALRVVDSPTGPIIGTVRNAEIVSGPQDDGQPRYVGTVVLDIPPEAAGHVYTLKVRPGDETMVVAEGFMLPEFPIAEMIPATIRIGVQSDATGINRSRFISFVPGHSGEQMAIRVKLLSLHHPEFPYTAGPTIPFTSFEGQYRWVGPPTQFVESVASAVPFYSANLQCEPHYQDWSSAGYLHVTGSAVVPSSQYEVQFVPASCMGSEDTCAEISAPLLLKTTRWADVESPFAPPTTSIQPDLADVSALVNKFRNAAGAPIKARALLAGTDAAGNINLQNDLSFAHISACVDAFRGAPYPHTGPEACP